MRNSQFGNHYIKEWRLFRGLSLRKLAARMESEPGIELISYASLARIETGKQPYSEPILEALGQALSIPAYYLLSRKPDTEADVISLFDTMDDSQKKQALAVLKAIAM